MRASRLCAGGDSKREMSEMLTIRSPGTEGRSASWLLLAIFLWSCPLQVTAATDAGALDTYRTILRGVTARDVDHAAIEQVAAKLPRKWAEALRAVARQAAATDKRNTVRVTKLHQELYTLLVRLPPDAGVLRGLIDEQLAFVLARAAEIRSDTSRTMLLAWYWSPIARACVRGFKAAGDASFLTAMVRSADIVLGYRDDALGLRDEVRERSLPAWGWTHAGAGVRSVEATATGLIALPYALFAEAVLAPGSVIAGDDALNETAHRYLNAAKDAADTLRGDIKIVPGSPAGYFEEPFRGIVEANNHQAAFGSLLAVLYSQTGDRAYRDAAQSLGRFWLLQVSEEPGGGFSWPYQAGRPGNDLTWKAAHTIQFPLEAFDRGMAIDRAVIDGLLATFRAHVYLGYGSLNMFTSGRQQRHYTGLSRLVEAQNPGLAFWMRLAQHDPDVLNLIEHLVATRMDLFPDAWWSSPGMIWAYAYRLWYYETRDYGAGLAPRLTHETLVPLLTLGSRARSLSQKAAQGDGGAIRPIKVDGVTKAERDAFAAWLRSKH